MKKLFLGAMALLLFSLCCCDTKNDNQHREFFNVRVMDYYQGDVHYLVFTHDYGGMAVINYTEDSAMQALNKIYGEGETQSFDTTQFDPVTDHSQINYKY